MILQSTLYSCGPCALVNACRALGLDGLTEEESIDYCGASPIQGCNAQRLRTAVRRLYLKPQALRATHFHDAHEQLTTHLKAGRPVILLVDQAEHWVCAIGTVGSRILVADSGVGELVLSWDAEKLARKWRFQRPRYYGMAIHDPENDTNGDK